MIEKTHLKIPFSRDRGVEPSEPMLQHIASSTSSSASKNGPATRLERNFEMGSKRIAVFSLAYAPFFGGAEVATHEIIKRVPHRFTVFTYRFESRWPDYEKELSAEIVRVGKGKEGGNLYGRFFEKVGYVVKAYKAAKNAHEKEPFAATWAIMASYAGFAALLFKLRFPTVPLLLTIQEGDSEKHILRRVSIFYPFWKKIFSEANRVQVISSYLKDFARRHGAIAPIEVVPNGVDLTRFTQKKNNGKEKTPKHPWVIITTSRLVPKNGIDTLIKAAAALSRNEPTLPFKVIVVGGGPEEAKLRALALSLNIASRIEFIAGQVAPSWIPRHLQSGDIFVRASRSEGLGNSFLEAMAVGLPVIGTHVGGISDFLKSPEEVGLGGSTGIFTRVDDSEDLALKINLLIKNNELRRTVAANGRTLVQKHFSWEKVASKMRAIFEQLVESS